MIFYVASMLYDVFHCVFDACSVFVNVFVLMFSLLFNVVQCVFNVLSMFVCPMLFNV